MASSTTEEIYQESIKFIKNSEAFKQIKTYVDNFKDLQVHEIINNEVYTMEISRTKINYGSPYSIVQVLEFEKQNNIILPQQLKAYLTEISRDIYKPHLEFQTIKLEDDDNLSKPYMFLKSCIPYYDLTSNKILPYDIEYIKKNIKEYKNHTDNEIKNVIDEYTCITPYKLKQFQETGYILDEYEWHNDIDDELFNGTMLIRDIGCGYTNRIILNGQYYGKICTEYICGDGNIEIEYDTFFNYIVKDICS